MISEYLQEKLSDENLELNDFRELIVRLLNYGVLCRNESLIEQQLYDRYLRLAPWIQDYLSLMDVRLYHDQRFEYLRAYPPGSEVPGREGDETMNNNLRLRLNQNEVAMVLVLRLQYDKALREGLVDDQGYVTESLEAISIASKNLLGRSLPNKVTERKALFQRLRKLRLIEYRQEIELDNSEAWIKIHPMIVNFVTDEALSALNEDNVLIDDEMQNIDGVEQDGSDVS